MMGLVLIGIVVHIWGPILYLRNRKRHREFMRTVCCPKCASPRQVFEGGKYEGTSTYWGRIRKDGHHDQRYTNHYTYTSWITDTYSCTQCRTHWTRTRRNEWEDPHYNQQYLFAAIVSGILLGTFGTILEQGHKLGRDVFLDFTFGMIFTGIGACAGLFARFIWVELIKPWTPKVTNLLLFHGYSKKKEKKAIQEKYMKLKEKRSQILKDDIKGEDSTWLSDWWNGSDSDERRTNSADPYTNAVLRMTPPSQLKEVVDSARRLTSEETRIIANRITKHNVLPKLLFFPLHPRVKHVYWFHPLMVVAEKSGSMVAVDKDGCMMVTPNSKNGDDLRYGIDFSNLHSHKIWPLNSYLWRLRIKYVGPGDNFVTLDEYVPSGCGPYLKILDALIRVLMPTIQASRGKRTWHPTNGIREVPFRSWDEMLGAEDAWQANGRISKELQAKLDSVLQQYDTTHGNKTSKIENGDIPRAADEAQADRTRRALNDIFSSILDKPQIETNELQKRNRDDKAKETDKSAEVTISTHSRDRKAEMELDRVYALATELYLSSKKRLGQKNRKRLLLELQEIYDKGWDSSLITDKYWKYVKEIREMRY